MRGQVKCDAQALLSSGQVFAVKAIALFDRAETRVLK